jgi:stage II sporulation protein AA (anti-sigma F factor antagonist)
MTIIHSVHRQYVHVRIKGDLDLKTAEPLRDSLDQLIDRYGDKDLVLDLEDVPFIDSSGLGVILGRYRRLTQQNRSLRLEGVRPSVKVVLELAGIDSIISIGESPEGRPTTPQPQA